MIMKKDRVIVSDKSFVPYIGSEDIDKAITNIADRINKDYEGREPIFISTLNGAFMFTTDLLKKIETENIVSFIKVASYVGEGSVGSVMEIFGLNVDIEGRDVIIVDDIVDTGLTITYLYDKLKSLKPRSIAIACLIFKENKYQGLVDIDYKGIIMPENSFIVGYGLDYNQRGRGLPDIYIAEE